MLIELHEHVRLFVIEASFYEINQLRDTHLDHALIAVLV